MYGSHHNSNHHHHHHYPNQHHKSVPQVQATTPEGALAADIFEKFIAASTFKSVLYHYRNICDVLKLRPTNFKNFYPKLKNKIRSWKAQQLWTKFDKRAAHKCYNHGKACKNSKVLVIGCGPCGLRTAIEAQLLGAKVVVVEKRDRFSRNNVLHLWPFVIADLKALGAKKFYGKFCAGAIDHISIRQLQCILLKVALLLGVEVIEAVAFEDLLTPPDDQNQRVGWHARFSPADHPVNQYEFDVLVGADGKRNTLTGFKRKEFRGKLAIAITANFINRRTEQEASVQEISGVAFIFNQKFFKDLYAETGIDLENIVYYKDETHYFVMTAKKHSLINKGVILRDLSDTQELLHTSNVDKEALCDYAREAADFSTNYHLPHTDFAVNHYGKPDIAMFDFTSMFAAENACRVVVKNGHKLLQCLVGDSLLEPFWPTGSGCARGFLSSFDACWAIRSWSSGTMTPAEVIAERESLYRILAQTTPENLAKDISGYTLEPQSRYPTVNLRAVLPFQVRNLLQTDGSIGDTLVEPISYDDEGPRKRKRIDSNINPDTLLEWCQKEIEQHDDLKMEDFEDSLKDGRVFGAIIHRYYPYLMDYDSLKVENASDNIQLAFDILQTEFSIQSVTTGVEMVKHVDKLSMISYISQIHDVFRGKIPQLMVPRKSDKSFDFDDFPTPLDVETKERRPLGRPQTSKSEGNLLKCKLLSESEENIASSELRHKGKKRKNESGSLDRKCEERRNEIALNREERQRKQKEQRELDRVRFIRSMRQLHCATANPLSSPSYNAQEDAGLTEYRKMCAKTMKQKAKEMEMKIYFPDKLNDTLHKATPDTNEDFTDRVKDLEAKFNNTRSKQKPKDMIRAIGKLEKSDWNLAAIEQKMLDSNKPVVSTERERVPKWNRDAYEDKQRNFERRLRDNGANEAQIAKYMQVDEALSRIERKMKHGSDMRAGTRGHNKVSDLASQLSSKLVHKPQERPLPVRQPRPIVVSSSGLDLCHLCKKKVYLAERISADGKFLHKTCFRCSYCNALLRIGHYIYDREGRYGGQYFCIPHYRMTAKTDAKSSDVPPLMTYQDKGTASPHDRKPAARDTLALLSPGIASLEDRGATPERAEFENSVIEQSDEDEYLSEDEWTDRNFGASTNELDSEDDTESSDISDDDVDDYESDFKMDDDVCRATSTDSMNSEISINQKQHSESDHFTEEHDADGDESHTATEGEDDGADDDEGEAAKAAMEVRRQELNINFKPPTCHSQTSDSGSETEIASDEESATQIDTDSEFGEDIPHIPKEIPTIVINEDIEEPEVIEAAEPEVIPDLQGPNPRTEQLKRLLQKTESTEAVTAKWNPQAYTNLRGNMCVPKKSASSVDLGTRFQSFMEKISATQKKLNPAPEPSQAMQAFLSVSSKNSSNPYIPIEKIPEPKIQCSDSPSSESPDLNVGKVFVFANDEDVPCVADKGSALSINDTVISDSVEAINPVVVDVCNDSDVDDIFNQLADDALGQLENTSINLSRILQDSSTDQNCNVSDEQQNNNDESDIVCVENLETKSIEGDEVKSDTAKDSEDDMLADMEENYVLSSTDDIDEAPEKAKLVHDSLPVEESTTSALELDKIEFMDTSESSSDTQSQFSYSKIEEPVEPTSEPPPSPPSSPPSPPIPKRYEGYIPRFKDRVTPFRYVRDSIDVRKNFASKPLFTPSKEDIAERRKNQMNLSKSLTSPSVPMTVSNISTSTPKPTDRDLVRDLVLSRISKKDKRRSSKDSLSTSNNSSVKSPFSPLSTSVSDILSPEIKPPPQSPITPLPETPLTHPEKFQATSMTDDDLEYNVLEEDNHLLHRNVSKRLFANDSYAKDRTRRASESEIKISLPISPDPKMRDKELRLKKLLAEHRKKENEVRPNDKDIDSCIRDCLEEYRQKRFSEPVTNFNFESMPPIQPVQPVVSPVRADSVPPDVVDGHKRKEKKSKDRQRRRSWIQFVSGVFNKSDDQPKEDKSIGSPPVSPNSEALPPKSPTVKERLSKLRISRSKDKTKNKDDKGRSQSADPTESPNAISLPMSSSRTIFSFLSPKNISKTQSGSSYCEAARTKPIPRIQEESICDDTVTDPLPDRTPSARRHKAVLRAAMQAEHRRHNVAQEIQRQLEECEVKAKELELRGIQVEQALRDVGDGNENELTKTWFSTLREKNVLKLWEQKLMVKARLLQLDDQRRRLEGDLPIYSENSRCEADLEKEASINKQISEINNEQESLHKLLEEDRIRYVDEEQELRAAMLRKGIILPDQETGV